MLWNGLDLIYSTDLKLCIFNNYSQKAKWLLLNNPRDEVEGIIQ